jgi:multiple sugar transport system substrate-binding protein
MGHSTWHLHVWRSLLERVGLTLADVPMEWKAFWSFWCDKVQPALRKELTRDDVYGVALQMSVSNDAHTHFQQFLAAYGADYVTRQGRLVIDEPQVRDRLIRALDDYTTLYRKGCVPPDAVAWDGGGNNQAFIDQRVVMTPNGTLSVPNAIKAARPEDYAKNVATIRWPSGINGEPLAIVTVSVEAAVFNDGGHAATAKEFVRFLVADGWLAHWLDFAKDRLLPPMPALLDQPFWLDPGDPHRMASAIQFLTRPRRYDYAAVSGEWQHRKVEAELVWAKAIHRIATDGITPEQAVDEAIARLKQILSE